jgi:hypothetical protein
MATTDKAEKVHLAKAEKVRLAEWARTRWPQLLHEQFGPLLAPQPLQLIAARDRARSFEGLIASPSRETLRALETLAPLSLHLHLRLIGGRPRPRAPTEKAIRAAGILALDQAAVARKLESLKNVFGDIQLESGVTASRALALVQIVCGSVAQGASRVSRLATAADHLQGKSVEVAVRQHFLRALRANLRNWSMADLARLIYESRNDWKNPPCPAFAKKDEVTIHSTIRSDLTRL